MPNAVAQQIVDAMAVKFRTISGIGPVLDSYEDFSQMAGYPALCVYATDENTVDGVGVSSTRRKLWDMVVGVVGYTTGQDARTKAYDLGKAAETVIEADPTLGIGGVEQARMVGRTTANIGPADDQFAYRGMVDLVFHVRYRYVIGSP